MRYRYVGQKRADHLQPRDFVAQPNGDTEEVTNVLLDRGAGVVDIAYAGGSGAAYAVDRKLKVWRRETEGSAGDQEVLPSTSTSHPRQKEDSMATSTKSKPKGKAKAAKPKTAKASKSKTTKAKSSTNAGAASKREKYTERELKVLETAKGFGESTGHPVPIVAAEVRRVLAAIGDKPPFDEWGMSEKEALECAKEGGRSVNTRKVGTWKEGHGIRSGNRQVVSIAVASTKV